jgi:adenosylcobinamide-phosphate synthase
MGRAIEVLEAFFRNITANLTLSGAIFSFSLILATWATTSILVKIAAQIDPLAGRCIEVILIYYCLSVKSLEQAAMEVKTGILQEGLPQARKKVSLIVGRDVERYTEEDIARAAVETVAENLVDGVISPLFYAALGGAPLAMTYKMVNTLDSMVGYKNEKYRYFGKASARIDDLFNYIPARVSVPIIALAAQILSAKGARSFVTAIMEGTNHSSPNAGYPEAAFAGALAVKLNGPNYYGGKLVDKPYIGVRFGRTRPEHIKKACDLMMLSSGLWLGMLAGIAAFLKM